MRITRLTFGWLAGVLVCATTARADEETIPVDKVPKAILESVKKRFPKATVTEAAKEEEKGKVEYEISLKEGDTKIDAMFTPEGKLVLIEKVIDAKTLPKAVAAVLGEKYPKATYKTVEEVTKVTDGKEAVDFYEVLLVTADKKTYEVEITSDGKIKEVEEKKGDKEEKK